MFLETSSQVHYANCGCYNSITLLVIFCALLEAQNLNWIISNHILFHSSLFKEPAKTEYSTQQFAAHALVALLTITQLETHQVHSTSCFEFARSTQLAVSSSSSLVPWHLPSFSWLQYGKQAGPGSFLKYNLQMAILSE